jgi:hypothetical protein
MQPVVGDATGFNAKRNEFEPEYDHEAEVSKQCPYMARC